MIIHLDNYTFRYLRLYIFFVECRAKLQHWFFGFEWVADLWVNNISPERMEHKFLCMWWKRQNDECALHVLRRLSDSVSTPYAYNLFLQTERPVDTSSHSSTGLGLTATLNHSVHQRTTIKLMIQNQSCYHINKLRPWLLQSMHSKN